MPLTAEQAGVPNEAAAYLASLDDPEMIERVRCTIDDAHVFKLPKRPTAGGWRGADWTDEVWQGTLKVVERGSLTVILLLDRASGEIFAVCPYKDGAVDRCIDSSRYFVLRVEDRDGKYMYIGVAFNERNDAFDFNTSLEDSRREREAEANPIQLNLGPSKDYSMKDGQKIHIPVSKIKGKKKVTGEGERRGSSGGGKASFLKPSSKDTPRRVSGTHGGGSTSR